ncbi:sulfite exporter TauE/SafE family protein [Luteolibacter pohnpeiensis]|uniref:Probable membrane transporter protein n=1 Tax=Luteolibacter pohnpeiensis TaxID=454153 RepID=A0A934S9B5_9BACT|nr:sulfite exporter TauE/SafE family protein [Luteolibacter pohnpeiensis]MBK1882042.1 sulfite exporter TauE/SafE family protein [Luteolibacter pohnpeiensis]
MIRPNRCRLLPWLNWLMLFYGGWLVLVISGDYWQAIREHWGIAVAMAMGSYAAGATPMGGGTVGFPVLVLLFKQAPTLGRDFSFAVQSVGMTSASIFILCRRQEVEWPMLRWALLGSLIGTPLGILYIAPLAPPVIIKLLFAVVWCSFGVLHLYRLRELCQHEGMAPGAHRFDRNAGFLIGLLAGSTVAAITGVGIDMVLYAVLVLLCQADLKIAIPTSVIIMAWTSLLGILLKNLTASIQPGVFENWLAAAPVVILGAPLGAFVVERVGRKATLLIVSILCIGQFVWTVSDEWQRLGLVGVIGALGGVLVFNMGFEWLHRAGMKLARRGQSR